MATKHANNPAVFILLLSTGLTCLAFGSRFVGHGGEWLYWLAGILVWPTCQAAHDLIRQLKAR